jgi:hypothetical protein
VAMDVAAVLLFAGIGRSVHAHGLSVAGLASTAWPFLSGLCAGWVALAVSRRDGSSVSVLRVIAGQGTAVAFVFVALGFLGAVMVGWRLLAGLLSSPASPCSGRC